MALNTDCEQAEFGNFHTIWARSAGGMAVVIPLVQVSYEMPARETLAREIRALDQAGEELGVQERLVVTWDDEADLDGGISVVPAWKFLLGMR